MSRFTTFFNENYVIILSIPILFIIGVLCGCFPIFFELTPNNKRKFGIANAFAGGIFMGILHGFNLDLLIDYVLWF